MEEQGLVVRKITGDRRVGGESEYRCDVTHDETGAEEGAPKKRLKTVWLSAALVPLQMRQAYLERTSRSTMPALSSASYSLRPLPPTSLMASVPLMSPTQRSDNFAARLGARCETLRKHVAEQQKAEDQQQNKDKHDLQIGTGYFEKFDDLEPNAMWLKVPSDARVLQVDDEIWLARDPDEVFVATVLSTSKSMLLVRLPGARPELPHLFAWKLMKGDQWPTFAIQIASITTLVEDRMCMSMPLQEVIASDDKKIESFASMPPKLIGWKLPNANQIEELVRARGLNKSQVIAILDVFIIIVNINTILLFLLFCFIYYFYYFVSFCSSRLMLSSTWLVAR